MSSYSSQEIIAALRKAGFEFVSARGSHHKFRATRDGQIRTAIVRHPVRDMPDGTFASILRQAGLSRPEFDSLR